MIDKSTALKHCPGCNEDKEPGFFYNDKSRKDGRYQYCKDCSKKRRRNYTGDPEIRKLWEQENREKRNRQKVERHKLLDPNKTWAESLWQRHKITPEYYTGLLKFQGGTCAICNSLPGKKRLSVDHDHKCCPSYNSCGKCIRGLLCISCNTSLGHIENEPWFCAAKQYLNNW